MSIGIALGGLVSGLNAGAQLGNGIMDRKHRNEREAVADQRYKDKVDRQAGLDVQNKTLQDAQEQRASSTFKMNKQQHDFNQQVRDAGDLIEAYKGKGNKALAGMIKNTEKGQQMMQDGGFDDVEFQHTTGEDGTKTWYVLGKQKGGDTWGLINQDGQMAGENDQPMALGARGLYALGMHTMNISEEAANAAVAAAGKTQDNKRAAYATGRQRQADVMAKQGLNNKGKLDVASVKNSKNSKIKTAASKQDIANMTQILTSLGVDSSLIPTAAPRASIIYKNTLISTGDESKALDAVKQFMSEHVTTKPGTVYGTNPSFSATPLAPKGTLANGEKDMSALFMGKPK